MRNKHGWANEDSHEFEKVRVRRKEDFHFINIDLELQSSEDIKPLIKELEKDDQTLSMNLHLYEKDEPHFPYHLVTFEIGNYDISQSYDDENDLIGGVDVYLVEFCRIIEGLSKSSRKMWNNCIKKDFDIGFQSGNTQKSFRTLIQAETVKRCAELDATISLTIYPQVTHEMRKKADLKNKKK